MYAQYLTHLIQAIDRIKEIQVTIDKTNSESVQDPNLETHLLTLFMKTIPLAPP